MQFLLPLAKLSAATAGTYLAIRAQPTESRKLIVGGALMAATAFAAYWQSNDADDNNEKNENENENENQHQARVERERNSIARQGLLGLIFASTAAITAVLKQSGVAPTNNSNSDIAQRLALSIKCIAAPALVLAVAVQVVGSLRYPTENRSRALSYGGDDPAIRLPRSFLQNTLEQFVLHAAASLALSVALPQRCHVDTLVPALSALFVIGRVAFAVGYARHPIQRAFGFALTFIPSMAAIIASLFFAIKN
jgi:uncharacterized membrane protein YecN with MAPEG domain